MSKEMYGVGIIGIGSSLPEKVLTNADLEKIVDTSDEWITKRTGISERRILEKDKPGYMLGAEAARKAIDDAGITVEDIGLIIVSTTTPDYLTPTNACNIQRELGAAKAAAFDMSAACTGFIYALSVAEQFIRSDVYKYILVIATEAMSKAVEMRDRNTCVLFGDGAGAAVIGKVSAGEGILSTHLGADGNLGNKVTIPCLYMSDEDIEHREFENKRTIWQDGQEIYKFATRIMPAAVEKVVEDSIYSLEDVNYIIPHQANMRIIESAAKRLGISKDRVYTTIHKYGNLSSASIPVALDEAVKEGRIKKGDNLVFVGFGGGLTWGSTFLKWSK